MPSATLWVGVVAIILVLVIMVVLILNVVQYDKIRRSVPLSKSDGNTLYWLNIIALILAVALGAISVWLMLYRPLVSVTTVKIAPSATHTALSTSDVKEAKTAVAVTAK